MSRKNVAKNIKKQPGKHRAVWEITDFKVVRQPQTIMILM